MKKNILIIIGIFIFWYLVFAFPSFTFDWSMWSKSERGGFLMISLGAIIMYFLVFKKQSKL